MNCPHGYDRSVYACLECDRLDHACAGRPLPRPTDTDIVANLVLCEHAHGTNLGLDWCNVCGAISNDGGRTWTLPRVAVAARRLDQARRGVR